jgi:hypothetical protein
MSTKASRFETAREEAQKAWLRVLSTDLTPGPGFKLLAKRLMILEIAEGHGDFKVTGVALDPDPHHLDQVFNAWTESSGRRTIPVGIVYIGTDDDGGTDEGELVMAAIRAGAEILNLDADEMTDSILGMASTIALRVLSTGPDRAEKFITVTKLVAKPFPDSIGSE